MATAPKQPFVWGARGQKMTPAEVDRQRLVAQALMAKGADFSPAGHWTEALGRAFNGWASGRLGKIAGLSEEIGLAGAAEKVAPYLGGSPTVTASSMGGSPVATALAGGDFIDPVAGGVNFPASLIASESGGNWNALNSEGYGGRLQFGQERLADAARAGVIPMGLTGADFSRMSPEEQMAVEQWHFADIDRQAQAMGLYDYLGQNIGGVTITPDAIRGMAHLGGIGGAAKFIKSGGAYNPSDSNGTSLRDYGIAHGSGGGVTASTMGGSPVASALMSGPSSQELLGLLADPWVARQYGPVLQALAGNAASREQAIFAQQLAQSDPMYQAELAKLTAPAASPTAEREAFALAGGLQPGSPEWAHYMLTGQMPGGGEAFTLGEGQIRFGPNGEVIAEGPAASPDQPTSVQEYLFYQEQAAQAGQQPMSYSDWDMARKAAGASRTSVDVSTGGGKFEEAFAKGDAETIGTVYDAGLAATRNLGRIDQLEALLQEAPSGMGGRLAQIAGEWGLAVDGTDAVQAAQAMINSLVPEQRPAGSGPMSDADLELFKQSLPRIINTPGGNQLIVDTMRAIAQYDAQGAEIVQRMRLPEGDPNRLTRAEAFQMLQQRQNPLATFKGQTGATAAAPPPAADKPRKRYNPETGAFE